MFGFQKYIVTRPALTSSGITGDRHSKKYVEPFIGESNTHKLKKRVQIGEATYDQGTIVSVHDIKLVNEVYYALVSVSEGKEKQWIRNSKLEKPITDDTVQHNGDYGKAFEIQTILNIHSKTGSAKNSNSEYKDKLEKLQSQYSELTNQLPTAIVQKAEKNGKKAANLFLDSLQKNHKINLDEVEEIHHTPKGIQRYVDTPVREDKNPHDFIIKTTNPNLPVYGGSLKGGEGTIGNNGVGKFDSRTLFRGKKTTLEQIWKKHTINAIKNPDWKNSKERLNRAAQAEAAAHYARMFNAGTNYEKKAHLKSLLKLNPDVPYDYVDTEKQVSIPHTKMDHNALINSTANIRAIHIAPSNSVRIVDSGNRHLATIEHRTTHGPFVGPQVNVKLGSLSQGDKL